MDTLQSWQVQLFGDDDNPPHFPFSRALNFTSRFLSTVAFRSFSISSVRRMPNQTLRKTSMPG